MITEFKHPLILTTPPITGKKVRDAQWLLAGHNEIGKRTPQESDDLCTLTGRLDGVYGPVTAGAAKEAKYLLGYPLDAVDQVFGQTLYDYLIGSEELPAEYVAARKTRIATPTKVKALKWAISQIGTKEMPYGSNRTPYGKWYGMDGVPWCNIFVSYGINEALGTLDHPVWKYAYVPAMAHDAQMGRNHMSITYHPTPGDAVTYNWDGPNCHVEFFERDLGNNSFLAVGGNTQSNQPSSNGGQVSRSTRYYGSVSHFIKLSLP